MNTAPLYEEEARIKRCSFSSTQGASVTLELPSMEAMQAFLGNEGKRIAVVAILIGDDEAPESPKQDKRSVRAWKLCRDPKFQQFLYAVDEAGARREMLDRFGIESRSELDTSQDAADAFDLMCSDFNDWVR